MCLLTIVEVVFYRYSRFLPVQSLPAKQREEIELFP